MSSLVRKAMNRIDSPFDLLLLPINRFLTYNYTFPYKFREMLYRFICFSIRFIYGSISSKVKVADPTSDAIIDDLNKFGHSKNTNRISQQDLKSLRQSLAAMKPKIRSNPDNSIAKKVYSSSDLASNYNFLKLATNQQLIECVTSYLGAPPIIEFLTVWEVFPEAGTTYEMYFHMDHHGHRFLKYFVYLTDVDTGGGHHEYVLGTHREDFVDQLVKTMDNKNHHLKSQIAAKRKYEGGFLINNDVIQNYLGNQTSKITGPAGSSFIEDTRGLHRGTVLGGSSSRVVYQVLFTASHNYKDKATPTAKTDAYKRLRAEIGYSKKIFDRVVSRIVQI